MTSPSIAEKVLRDIGKLLPAPPLTAGLLHQFAVLAVGGKKPKRVSEAEFSKADAAQAPEALAPFVEQCLLDTELPGDAPRHFR